MYRYAPTLEDVTKLTFEEVAVLTKTKADFTSKDAVKVSKTLSAVLRHDKQGNRLRQDGWVLMEKLPVDGNLAMIAVLDNNKERFCVARGTKSGKLYIRANQGHSIPVELDLKAANVDVAYHGTTNDAWKIIEHEGLNKMGRQHIHMAKGLPGEVISGMRQNSEVVIQINVTDAIKAGIRFFESDNGVILSDGIDGGGVIPAQFLKRIH